MANSRIETLSSDLEASKESEKHLAARVRALTASLQKIEAEFTKGDDASSMAMAALVEESRRCAEALNHNRKLFFELHCRGGNASKGLQAMGGELKRMNKQVWGGCWLAFVRIDPCLRICCALLTV
jgi:hypothetical protein